MSDANPAAGWLSVSVIELPLKEMLIEPQLLWMVRCPDGVGAVVAGIVVAGRTVVAGVVDAGELGGSVVGVGDVVGGAGWVTGALLTDVVPSLSLSLGVSMVETGVA